LPRSTGGSPPEALRPEKKRKAPDPLKGGALATRTNMNPLPPESDSRNFEERNARARATAAAFAAMGELGDEDAFEPTGDVDGGQAAMLACTVARSKRGPVHLRGRARLVRDLSHSASTIRRAAATALSRRGGRVLLFARGRSPRRAVRTVRRVRTAATRATGDPAPEPPPRRRAFVVTGGAS
jgi:hypothetical protein